MHLACFCTFIEQECKKNIIIPAQLVYLIKRMRNIYSSQLII